MRRVFIAHPVRGDIESNLKSATSWVRWAATEMNVCPLAPYLYLCQALDDDSEVERSLGRRLGLESLKTADELWVCGPTITEGMQKEIDYAHRWALRVRYFETQRQRHTKHHEKCVHNKLLSVRCDKCGVVEEDTAP